MSQTTEAWSELYAAQTEEIGVAFTVDIGATSDIPAVVESVPRDNIFIDGGTASNQAFRMQLLASALSNVPPAKWTSVVFTPPGISSELTLAVLSADSNNGIFYVNVGDPNAIE